MILVDIINNTKQMCVEKALEENRDEEWRKEVIARLEDIELKQYGCQRMFDPKLGHKRLCHHDEGGCNFCIKFLQFQKELGGSP